MGAKAETIFGNELKLSIMHHANEEGMATPVILKMHGSVMTANIPDYLVMVHGNCFFMELKVKKVKPTRTFKLDADVSDGQRTMMKAMSLTGMPVFLIVKVSKNMALVIRILDGVFPEMKINPKEGMLLPGGIFRIDRNNGIWDGINTILNWTE